MDKVRVVDDIRLDLRSVGLGSPSSTSRERWAVSASVAARDRLSVRYGSRDTIEERTLPFFDLPLDDLRRYAPELPEPPDLDEFWAATLTETRGHDLSASFTAVDTGLRLVETDDLAFAGFGGTTVRGWLHRPAGVDGPLPAIVEYVGYGGGRGLAHERVLYALAGYVHVLMDTRGQGSGWGIGETPDPGGSGAPSHPGFLTQGLLDPADHYYRRVFMDGVRAVEAVRSHPAVDASRVVVTGGSQGGAISLAVGSLLPDVAGVMPDVPFLCHIERAIGLVDTNPYAEVKRYLAAHRDHVDQALRTLTYIDVARLGRRATAPALFSVGLMDETCPPSTVYAAFNAYGGPKDIAEYAYNDHEGGQGFHEVAKLRWLAEQFAV
jgi:cephalosporin-C deacetylase